MTHTRLSLAWPLPTADLYRRWAPPTEHGQSQLPVLAQTCISQGFRLVKGCSILSAPQAKDLLSPWTPLSATLRQEVMSTLPSDDGTQNPAISAPPLPPPGRHLQRERPCGPEPDRIPCAVPVTSHQFSGHTGLCCPDTSVPASSGPATSLPSSGVSSQPAPSHFQPRWKCDLLRESPESHRSPSQHPADTQRRGGLIAVGPVRRLSRQTVSPKQAGMCLFGSH